MSAGVEKVKSALGTTVFKPIGTTGGGSISSGAGYLTDNGEVYVKTNDGSNAKRMFEGELEGLLAIAGTKTVRVPRPICIVPLNEYGSTALVMENIHMKSITSHQQSILGEQLARLHLYNSNEIERHRNYQSRINTPRRECLDSTEDGIDSNVPDKCDKTTTMMGVTKFGFHTPTSCGYHSLNNDWNNDWDVFYIRQRLQPLVDSLTASDSSRELINTWPACSLKISTILSKIKECKPALLHGDLWNGNVGSVNGEPIIFDPGAFYGHSEFDFGIAKMFGGFSSNFYDSYYSIIPKAPGSDIRLNIYELFHHLNHWNLFGSSYRSSSIKLMKKILEVPTN